MEPDQLPRRSRRLLQLPPHFESFPSKRRKVIKRGTHTSTYQTCDHTRMSTESSQKDTGSPSTPIPTIVNGTPSTPSTTMVVVSEVPIITSVHPIVNTQPIAMNPFGSLCHSPGYNVQSIPMASSPFSYGMSNFTSQFSTSIPASSLNTSIGLGGTTPPHTPFSFGGTHVPQMTPTVGGFPPFNPGSNPVPNASGWSNQPGRQATAYGPSFTPTSSVPILTNTFGMTNPPLSSGFTPRGGQFHTLGNPQPGATPGWGQFLQPSSEHSYWNGAQPTPHESVQRRVLQSQTGPWCLPEPWMGCDSPTTIFPGSLGPDVATPSPFSGHAQSARLV
jgi:hypothetical protein